MQSDSQSKATFRDILEECDELPGLVYFEANEGPDAFFIADSYEHKCVQQLRDEELAFAIRDRLDILPKMYLEIERLRCSLKNLSHAVEHQWPAKSDRVRLELKIAKEILGERKL